MNELDEKSVVSADKIFDNELIKNDKKLCLMLNNLSIRMHSIKKLHEQYIQLNDLK